MTRADDTPPRSRADVRAAYRTRRDERAAVAAGLASRDRTLAALRVGVFLAGLVLAWLVLARGSLGLAWLSVPLLAFLGLVVVHARVMRSLARATRAVLHYDAGIRRLDDAWAGEGDPGDEFRDPDHPYAEDLDLFGKGSLFERLAVLATATGRRTLAGWLLAPANAETVARRQAAIAELRDDVGLRERLIVTGSEVRVGGREARIESWVATPDRLGAPPLRALGVALTLAAVAGGVGWAAGAWPGHVLALVAIAELALWLVVGRTIRAVLADVEPIMRDLDDLAPVLEFVESGAFEAPLLGDLRSAMDVTRPAPAAIARLRRLVELVDSTRNPFFAPAAFLLLWSFHLAVAVERWRSRHGDQIDTWFRVAGELDALVAIAGYAHECPEDRFPSLETGAWRLSAEGLGHPLIPIDRAVRNEVTLGVDGPSLLVVSGSNMSGKSTLLRAVGLNAVLAQAGAPVRAHSFRLTPLTVGASIQTVDSLAEGRSRFYAEISRLRQLMTLAEDSPPLLFLVDEVLAGTNSHDRRIGSRAVLSGFLARGACGLVTTHDLALTELVDQLGAPARNVHFEDHLAGGVMHFDYRLRDGVVTKSNAVALMRSVGLDV